MDGNGYQRLLLGDTSGAPHIAGGGGDDFRPAENLMNARRARRRCLRLKIIPNNERRSVRLLTPRFPCGGKIRMNYSASSNRR